MPEEDFSMHRLLGEIASDTKHILDKLSSQAERLDKHSDRIMVLERRSWRQVGMVSAIATFIPIALTVGGWFISQ